MSLSDLAQKILTTGGNLTMVVGNLEKQGLAQRQRCPEDGRVLIVVLTARAKVDTRDFSLNTPRYRRVSEHPDPEEQEHLASFAANWGKANEPAVVRHRVDTAA